MSEDLNEDDDRRGLQSVDAECYSSQALQCSNMMTGHWSGYGFSCDLQLAMTFSWFIDMGCAEYEQCYRYIFIFVYSFML